MGGLDTGREEALERLLPLLRCPATAEPLERVDGLLVDSGRTRQYPVIDGTPILLADDEEGMFRIEDFAPDAGRIENRKQLSRRLGGPFRWALQGFRFHGSDEGVAEFGRLALEHGGGTATILVIGGGERSTGIEQLALVDGVELIETDVYLGETVDLVVDGQNLPFRDGSADGVISQAVIEHVADPWKVIAECHRVLKDGAPIYTEAPFIQQVHMGPYDFFRFSPAAMRLIHRDFEEVEMKVVNGPGMALSWSAEYFVRSFRSRFDRMAIWMTRLTKLLFLPALLLDRFLVGRPGAWDAAAGTAFLGRKSDRSRTPRELVSGYRGINWLPEATGQKIGPSGDRRLGLEGDAGTGRGQEG